MTRTATLLLATALLAGCQSDGRTAAPPPSSPVTSASQPAEPVTLTYAADRELDLYLPAAGGPAPVVVLLHGVTDDPSPKDLPAFADWGRRLTERGLAVAVPNYRDDLLAGPESLADVRAVLDTLGEQADEVDVRRRALLGFSGAGPALVRAAYSPWAQPLSALAAFYAPLEDPAPGRPTSLSTQRTRSAAARELPVLVAYGRQDTVTGVVESVPRLRRRDPEAGEVTVLVHPTGAHAFDVFQPDDPDTQRIVDETVDWLAEQLA